MKLNRFQKILPLALLTAVAAEPALAAAGTQSVTNFFNTIQGTLQTVSLVVVTISVMWAGFECSSWATPSRKSQSLSWAAS